MIKTFESTVGMLELIKNDESIPTVNKRAMLACIRLETALISVSIEYRLVKIQNSDNEVVINTSFIDESLDSDLLEKFFGNCSLLLMKRNLSELRQKIIEAARA